MTDQDRENIKQSAIDAGATSTDVTADWKTYKNEKYGFEISFPSDWRVDSTSPSNIYLISPTTDKMVKDYPNQPANQRVDLSISVSLDPQRPLGTKKNITFNGMNTEQVTQGSEEGIWTSLYLDKNGYTYIITPVKKSNIGEQILSTFKFTTPVKTSCTPNWQCGWGECKNGYQGMTAVDSNNCGLSSALVEIECLALVRECSSQ
jgi:hypothetical protein